MARKFTVSGASVLGRDHALVHKNCQDSYMTGQTDTAVWGVVCDGCGEGRRSEVGAHLTALSVARNLQTLANKSWEDVDTTKIEIRLGLHDLYYNLLHFIYDTPDERIKVPTESLVKEERAFAFDYLLCTVVGFFVHGNEGLVFWIGDGSFLVGDTLEVLDSDNHPVYPIYPILAGTGIGDKLQVRSFKANEVSRVAVTTDGFNGDFAEVWDKNPSALKRWMNVVQKRDRRFSDDATIITAQWAEEPEPT